MSSLELYITRNQAEFLKKVIIFSTGIIYELKVAKVWKMGQTTWMLLADCCCSRLSVCCWYFVSQLSEGCQPLINLLVCGCWVVGGSAGNHQVVCLLNFHHQQPMCWLTVNQILSLPLVTLFTVPLFSTKIICASETSERCETSE